MIAKAVLIYNPASGYRGGRHGARIQAAAEVFRRAGVETELVATRAPACAGEQAAEAVARGCDAVLACGGDGTVHEVLQGMVGSKAALGVIPLGTANALACDLGIPRDPAAAARLLLDAKAERIALGRIDYCVDDGQTTCRYFTVAAGIGPDAFLFYRLNRGLKRRFGYAVYVAEALRTWALHSYPLFEVEIDGGTPGCRREQVSQVLAVRISNFGGILRRLAPGAGLHRDDIRLVLFKTRSRARYLRYMAGIMLGRIPRVREIELVTAASCTCRPLKDAPPIFAEADGELLGRLPVKIGLVREQLRLLMPQ